jgi:hypothetical protein
MLARINNSNDQTAVQQEVKEKLQQFVEIFVFFGETQLSEYYNRLLEGTAKPGKWADVYNQFGEIEDELSSISKVFALLSKAGSRVCAKFNRNGVKKLANHLFSYKNYPRKAREHLIKAGIEIFRCYECQFVQSTCERGSWERAMVKYAEDAIGRVFNYLKSVSEQEFSTQTITKGVIEGESKKYKDNSTGMPHILQKGHTLKSAESVEWNSEEVFAKTGLVTLKKDGTADIYYKSKSRSDTDKYGFRLLFECESEDRKEKIRKLNNKYGVTKPPREEYRYVLATADIGQLQSELLAKINSGDPNLMEERFKEFVEEFKQEAEKNCKELEKFISSNFKKLTIFIEQQLKEDGEQRKEMHKTNIGEHGKSQKIDVLTNQCQKAFEKLEKKTKKPIWFKVEIPVTTFVTRQNMVSEITEKLKKGIVVISGMSGMGKSELAKKYAQDHREDYNGNVIWINAKVPETMKKSFYIT